jgi:site-specific recombinase
MGALDSSDGLRALLAEVAMLLRSQSAALLGNLLSLAPAMLLVAAAMSWLSGRGLMSEVRAQSVLNDLSLVGPTPLYAVLTGLLIWLASLFSGLADNWFALRRMRETIVCQRRLVYALGSLRVQRLAAWAEGHVADIAGNLALAALFGLTPAVAHFFGVPLEVRHVTLAAAQLLAAVSGMGWHALAEPAFWLAAAGVLGTGLFNVAVAFVCALSLAMHARGLSARARRLILRAVLRRFAARPGLYLLPQQGEVAAQPARAEAARDERRRVGRG